MKEIQSGCKMFRVVNLLKPYKGLKKEIYLLSIARFVNALGALIYPFMSLILTGRIGLTSGQAGLYIMFNGIIFSLASLWGGRLADFYGRKKLIVGFEAVAMVVYGYCFFLEPTIWMVCLLTLAGACFGVAGPAHEAMVADLTTIEQREGAYSLLYLGFNLGYGFAMILAGKLFAEHLNLMFLIDAATAGLAILLVVFFIKDPFKRESACSDGRLVEQANESANNEKNQMEDRTIDREESILTVILAKPELLLFAFGIFGYRLLYSQWGFLLPLHTVALFGKKAGGSLYGQLGSLNAIVVVFFTAVLTRLFMKKTPVQRSVYAGILFTLGFGLFAFWTTPIVFYVGVTIFTLGEILEAISVMPYVMRHTPETHRARMSAFLPLIMGAGYGLGPPVMGIIKEKTSFQTTWLVSSGIGLLATFVILGLSIKGQNKEKING